jgi:hypothetical protein
MLTYGDGLSDVDIGQLFKFHKKHKRKATVTAVMPPGRFGALEISSEHSVSKFMEKPTGDGNFINGEFYKSDWEGGTFSGGRFWNSKWYNGLFENGLIGSKQVSTSDTKFYNGTVSYAVVENATLYAEDTSLNKNINANIEWNDGYFNNGVFGSNISQTASNSAIWNDGTFNGGQFISNGRWKKGTFNNGLFISGYGWTQSDSLTQSDYGWESGTFNNGKFGNANGLTNSTWYTGEFHGGIFSGRVWNNGIFLQGELQGSGVSTIGGLTCGSASVFVDSFSHSYWGLWRSGIFTNIKDKFINDQVIYTIPTRVRFEKRRGLIAKFKNGLWLGGTFSHPGGEMSKSVWLDGAFERGKFIGSSFNPYVKRNGSTQSSFNLNDSTCYWKNGDLENSDFDKSDPLAEKFLSMGGPKHVVKIFRIDAQ